MNLTLYSVTDSNNVIGKLKSNDFIIPIKLKHDVDVENPTILLSKTTGVNYNDYNYAFIDILNRYYFITDSTVMGGNITELRLKVDVLETYKNDILNSNARLMRGIKTGDYMNARIDENINATATIYESNKGLIDGESTKIFIVIGD